MSALRLTRHIPFYAIQRHHAIGPLTLRCIRHVHSEKKKKKRAPIDESSWASAQHKPSLGNASLGHMVSELSSTKEGMEHLRVAGQTMSEEHRAEARGVVKWLFVAGAIAVGVPVGLGVRKMAWGEGSERRDG